MLNGIRDAQEVENFLWHLENYFKCSKVKRDKNKINNVVLYLHGLSECKTYKLKDDTWSNHRMEFHFLKFRVSSLQKP